jgi:adenine-specific DNA-methyltransferase
LKPGGRFAFVVPSEIGHAPYAAPLLDYLVERFSLVHVVAVRKKLFPELSEDCWLLYADGFGGTTDHIRLTVQDTVRPPRRFLRVNVAEWRGAWSRRLRPFLIHPDARDLCPASVPIGRTICLRQGRRSFKQPTKDAAFGQGWRL